jgi:hypothetical protein
MSIQFPLKLLSVKGNSIHVQSWTNPKCSSRLRVPEFLDDAYKKVVSFSTLRTGTLYPHPGNIYVIHFYSAGGTAG